MTEKSNQSLRYADFFVRFLSNLIDITILVIILSVSSYLLSMFEIFQKHNQIRNIIVWLYLSLFLASKYHATPGKILFGLCVISNDRKELKPIKAISRSILIVFIIGLIEIILIAYLNHIAELRQKPLDDSLILTISILASSAAVIIYSAICLITYSVSKEKITIHDFICGTRVIKIPKQK